MRAPNTTVPSESTAREAPPADSVRPVGLLNQAQSGKLRPSGITAGAARAAGHQLLRRMSHDRITIVEGDNISLYGVDGGLDVAIEIFDQRAWTALLREGSIGLGRGYFEGWWHSDDPTAVVQIIIRNLPPVDELRNQLSNSTSWLTDRVRALNPARLVRIRDRNREDIASHYDLGNDFFQIFLDETLTYSAAIFPSAETALAEGSHHKYDRLLKKLGVDADHRLLEIGTGWGGFALRAVDTAGCKVTTTTISAEQLREASQRVQKAGRQRDVELLNRDWRDLEGTFDRIVSIEMIEAVDWKDYERYFRTIERCLEPDGLVGLQAICVPDRRYERTKNTEDFIRRFVFPGGFLPSVGAINRAVSSSTRLQLVDVEDLSAHYAETLRRWRIRFDERLDDVRKLGLDERFIRMWRFYLAYCEAGFLERHCTVNQIVLAGPEWRPNGLSLRPA